MQYKQCLAKVLQAKLAHGVAWRCMENLGKRCKEGAEKKG
jgi:hypothetical protein